MIKYREHLYRAWDIQNERMIENPFNFVQDWEDKNLWVCYEDWRDYEDGISRKCYVMQYTGEDDSDGKKIFEGDIVKSLIHNPNHFKVEFIEGGYCMTHPNIEGYPIDINHFGGKIKVVGTIFQNPDLLK